MLPDIAWQEMVQELLQLGIAGALAMIIGWHREKNSRSAGLRTFPLVAMASCSYVMLGRFTASGDPNAEARILQGLMTGIGFIGGGAILKHKSSVTGTATAASVWTTGAMGAAVAYARYDLAVALSMLNLLIFYAAAPFKSCKHDEGSSPSAEAV